MATELPVKNFLAFSESCYGSPWGALQGRESEVGTQEPTASSLQARSPPRSRAALAWPGLGLAWLGWLFGLGLAGFS